MATQVDKLLKKAIGTLAFIRKGSEYKSWNVMIQQDGGENTFGVQLWSQCHWNDIVKLARMQKRSTKILRGLEGLNCKERLGLLSLEHTAE